MFSKSVKDMKCNFTKNVRNLSYGNILREKADGLFLHIYQLAKNQQIMILAGFDTKFEGSVYRGFYTTFVVSRLPRMFSKFSHRTDIRTLTFKNGQRH